MKIGNKQLNNMQMGIVGLTVATAVIHIVLGVMFAPGGLILFGGNGVVYMLLLWALYWPMPIPALASIMPYIRWIFIGFTALTIVLYFVMNPTPFSDVLGLIDKAIEVALIVLLYLEK